MGDLQKLGGLWKNKRGAGYSGPLAVNQYNADAIAALIDALTAEKPVRVSVFKNTHDSERSPDLDLCFAVDDE